MSDKTEMATVEEAIEYIRDVSVECTDSAHEKRVMRRALDALDKVGRYEEAVRYCLATVRTMERFVFDDSDFGLLLKEATAKLEALNDEEGDKE